MCLICGSFSASDHMILAILFVKSFFCTEMPFLKVCFCISPFKQFTCRRCQEVLCEQCSGGGQHKELTLDPSLLPSDTEE